MRDKVEIMKSSKIYKKTQLIYYILIFYYYYYFIYFFVSLTVINGLKFVCF